VRSALTAKEPTYNPYYTLILQRLCADSYSHRFTLQYALWDFLREMGEAGVGGSGSGAQFGGESDGRSVKVEKAINIARAVAFGVARGSLDLTLFKVRTAALWPSPLTHTARRLHITQEQNENLL
jgi:nucleolar MIF4G domain-containing protein 1